MTLNNRLISNQKVNNIAAIEIVELHLCINTERNNI